MRRFALIIPLILQLSALGQAIRVDDNATTTASNVPPGASANIMTVPNAIISVCAYPTVPISGSACTNTVPIFSDQALTQNIPNPIQADAKGRYGFWIAPGMYGYTVQSQNGNFVGNFALSIYGGFGGISGTAGCPTLSVSGWTVNQANCYLNGATWSNPLAFGITSGSSTNTVTATGSGTSLTLSSASDFAANQGIMVAHGGAVCGSLRGGRCTAPPTPTVAHAGTAGTTTYNYILACIDGLGGIGPAGGAGTTTTGAAVLTGTNVGSVLSGNYNIVTWTGNSTCTEVAIYRNNSLVSTMFSAPSGTITFNDTGLPAWTNRDIPSSPPSLALADNYSGMITALIGTAATISPALGASVTGLAYHNDAPLFQAAIASNSFVNVPPGKYLITYPIDYTKAGSTVSFGISGAISGPGTLICDAGDFCLDVTGDDNIVLSQFSMGAGTTNPSSIDIYCARDTTLHGGVAQNVLTDHLIITNRAAIGSLGGIAGVGFYNHACEIQHNYDDQFQVARWAVLTGNNVYNVSSPFDANDDRSSQSMSQVEFHSTNGAANLAAEIEDAFTINFMGGYVLGASASFPWAFQIDNNVGRLTIDKMRLESKGGVVDIASGGILNEPYIDVDTYRVPPLLGLPQFRLNGTSSIAFADMLRSDDYGGSGGSVSALVDGDAGCNVTGSIMRIGIFETIGTCVTSGLGNTISGQSLAPGATNADWAIPPTYQLAFSASPTWIKLGTWVSDTPGVGDSLHIALFSGGDFSQGTNSQSMADIIVRNANGIGSAPNLSGSSLFFSGSSPFSGLKIVATGGSTSPTNKSWDIYIMSGSQAAGSYRIDKNSTDQWINSNTMTSDPGPASTTIAVGKILGIMETSGVSATACTLNATRLVPVVINGATVNIATCN